MQTIVVVHTSKSSSMRDRIVNDRKLHQFGLTVSEKQNPDREPGWSKLHGTTAEYGAINIEWHAQPKMLVCRVVTKGGDPAQITGRFVTYVVSRFRREVTSIVIRPDV